MATHLSPEGDRYIKEAVASGTYPSEEVAINEAVELLKRRDELRADVLAGVREADRGELLPADQVFERLEKRAREIESNARTDAQ